MLAVTLVTVTLVTVTMVPFRRALDPPKVATMGTNANTKSEIDQDVQAPNTLRVHFLRIAQFEDIAECFLAGQAQIVQLGLAADAARLAVSFMLGVATGGRGELDRLDDGTYLLAPAGWTPSRSQRLAMSLAA